LLCTRICATFGCHTCLAGGSSVHIRAVAHIAAGAVVFVARAVVETRVTETVQLYMRVCEAHIVNTF